MRLKLFLFSFSITVLVITVIIVFLEQSANQDESNYISTFEYIDATTIKTKSADFVVIIISQNCPGRSTFMPQVKEIVDKLDTLITNYYIINDSPITKESDQKLTTLISKYIPNTKVYHFDKNIYKTNGGLINAKRRYYDFVLDLSPNVKELYLGYGYYIVFADSKFQFDTYKYQDILSYYDE
jgi:hypothetical protein